MRLTLTESQLQEVQSTCPITTILVPRTAIALPHPGICQRHNTGLTITSPGLRPINYNLVHPMRILQGNTKNLVHGEAGRRPGLTGQVLILARLVASGQWALPNLSVVE